MFAGSWFFASFVAYPCLFVREMVDLWPKERGGHCTFNNSYSQGFKFMVQDMEWLYFNFMANYWTWFRRQGAMILISLWVADSLGMLDPVTECLHSLENMSPIANEAN